VPPSYTSDGSTWSEGYGLVYHLDEITGSREDSTSNGLDSVVQEVSNGDTNGVIDGADYFGGNQTNDRLFPLDVNPGFFYDAFTQRTYSAWVSIDSSGGPNVLIDEGGSTEGIGLAYRSTPQKIAFAIRQGGQKTEIQSATTFPTADPIRERIHVTAVFDSSNLLLYINGQLDIAGASANGDTIGTHTESLGIGGKLGGTSAINESDPPWHGFIDEVRASGVSRSSNWVWATYLNTASNAAFLDILFAEGGDTPVVNNDGGASNITIGLTADLNGELLWTGAAPTKVSVYWGAVDAGTDKEAWDDVVNLGEQDIGLLTTMVSGLTENTEYFYRFYATNTAGEVWAPGAASFRSKILRPVVNNEAGASGITLSTAVLNGDLVSTGAAAAVATVYWGTTDAGTDKGNWDQSQPVGPAAEGLLTAGVTGLVEDTTYFYRYLASNNFGESWAPSSAVFSTSVSVLDTNRYGFRMKIDFTGYDRDETLVNFAALVLLNETLTGFEYDDFASLSGGDLRFTADDGTTVLNHEIETWDIVGDSFVWVQIPSLTSNDFIYAYWGNPDAPVAPPYTADGSTWDANFDAVWHLDETGGIHLDATGNGHDGTPENGVIQDAAGQIDGADLFDGTNDQVTATGYTAITGTAPRSVSLWMKSGRQPLQTATLVSWGNNVAGARWDVRLATNGEVRVEVQGGYVRGGIVVTNETWHHVAVTWEPGTTADISNALIYVDGFLDPLEIIDTETVDTPGIQDTVLGSSIVDRPYQGLLDEVRIESLVRSSNWIWAAYANQVAGSTFAGYGPVEDLGGFTDTDGDGMPDFWEELHFGGPTNGVAGADNDGDTFDNLSEWIADTIPTNSASFFRLDGIDRTASYEIFFDSSTERVYTLQFNDSLRFVPAWSNILGQVRVSGTGSGDSLLDTNDRPARIYRIEVELP
jgi:hypothetical protein